MDTSPNDGYASTTSNPVVKDNMGLTADQRMMAWAVLAAGVVALIWALMRNPDQTNAYGTSTGTVQREPASSTGNSPR